MRGFDYRKLAELKWDNTIVSYLAKIHEAKGRQDLFIRQKPIELDRLVEIAKIQSTESSNKIEGIVTTSTRVRQLVQEKTTPRNRDEGEILGYRNVLNTIHENHDYIPISSNYILQLHRDMMKPAGLSYGGHYKNTQNYIQETKPDGSTFTRFTPVAPYETEAAVRAICDSYNQTKNLELIDPLLLIPAFIVDFLCIHPFNDGNGRMSRLMTLLLLYQNGYVVGKYMLQIILGCYVDFEERVGLLNDSGMKSSAYDIVKAYVEQKIGRFKSNEVIINCPSFGRTAIMDSLKKLTEQGIIHKHGGGRGTYYIKSDQDIDR